MRQGSVSKEKKDEFSFIIICMSPTYEYKNVQTA